MLKDESKSDSLLALAAKGRRIKASESLILVEKLVEISLKSLESGAPLGAQLEPHQLSHLFSLKPGPVAQRLFEGANQVRAKVFGSKVFLYGFIYLSTYCRNDCAFCHSRTSRKDIERYRLSLEPILNCALALKKGGVHLIDLTLGEDPSYIDQKGFENLCLIISRVKRETGLPVMLSAGVLDKQMLTRARQAGVEWLALYQETYNRALFKLWRRGQDFDERLESKLEALRLGFLVEEGFLVGCGEGLEDLAQAVLKISSFNFSQLRAMAYVPSPNGLPPSQGVDPIWRERLSLAVLRLLCPQALIAASLDVEGLAGLLPRLLSGANVVTSLIPSSMGLSGVASTSLDINNKRREPETVKHFLGQFGFQIAPILDYQKYLEKARKTIAT
ncbi:MAG: methylornithine synthase PylB [Deltaproteobacteria bacterium]|jgi:methylornithine synthase|nr:methylornithine synthase PylB [Deltaproteobacteria bacterium]